MRAREPAPDAELRGLGSLYRIYDTAEGHVFLAAPTEGEWSLLAKALAPYVDLAGDGRFADVGARARGTTALIEVLSAVFTRKPAADWEAELLPKGVACVQVTTTTIEEPMFDDSFGRASGYVVDVTHPTFDEHPRLAPYLRFSRSRTQALPAVLTGQHTDAILSELGKSAAEIEDLRRRRIVG